MAPKGSLLVSYLYGFPEIAMETGERRMPPRRKGKSKKKDRQKKIEGEGEDDIDMVMNEEERDLFKRRLLVVPDLTSASTVGDVYAHIYRELRVPATHGELSVLVRSLRRDVRNTAAMSSEELPTRSYQMLGEIGVVLHSGSSVVANATPAFHLRTRIAIKDYAPGGQFFNTYREDGGYRRETLSEALSKSWSVQLVIWAYNKHWVTRFALITFIITSLVGLAQQLNAMLGLS